MILFEITSCYTIVNELFECFKSGYYVFYRHVEKSVTMVKRFVSLFLAASFIFAINSGALAVSAGEATKVQAPHELLQKSYVQETNFDGIMESADGYYALKISASSAPKSIDYLPVGRVDIDLLDADEVDLVLENDKIPPEIKAEIERKQKQAVSSGTESARVTFFSSELLENTSANNSIYYTYNGHEMRSDRLYTYRSNTGWEYIKQGTTTRIVAASLFNIGLGFLGIKLVPVSILSSGLAVITAFTSVFGNNWIGGHAEDFLQMRLQFDDVKQWTYGNAGDGWRLGLCTENVVLTKIGVEQYYYNKESRIGRSQTSDNYVNVNVKSPHYDSPWATAWQYMLSPEEEWINWKVAESVFSF